MTPEIILVFSILLTALVLFFTGWIRMDVVALLVLGLLAFSGLISPTEALSGFSNPAVITVWSMFILSAAISQTGIARMIGSKMYKLAGKSEWRVILVIMLISGAMSSVMNNIGVAALMLPVVMDIARTTGRSPARLLLPLALSTHLGGLTTLIGNPSNILVSVELEKAGLKAFNFLDFAPLGLSVMIAGTIFVAIAGRHLLRSGKPSEQKKQPGGEDDDLTYSYHLSERTFIIKIHEQSALEGKTLAESRLRPALGINVLSVKRENGTTVLNPGPDTLIKENDQLFVQGRFSEIKALKSWEIISSKTINTSEPEIDFHGLNLFEITIDPLSPLTKKSAARSSINFSIIALRRKGHVIRHQLEKETIEENDILLVQSDEKQLENFFSDGVIESYKQVSNDKLRFVYKLHEHVFFLKLGDPSQFFSNELTDNQLGQAFGLKILGLKGSGSNIEPVIAGEKFMPNHQVLVMGNPKDLPLLKELMNLILDDVKVPDESILENNNLIMAEILLAPRSVLAGKTLKEINFRKRFGLTILALWREGRALRTNIHNLPLRFGEAMLVYGKRDKIDMMGSDSDFILLTQSSHKPLRTHKAFTAIIITIGVLLPVILGVMPIEITSVVGVALMVLTGCLSMEEAYQSIEWKSVFLIAGMLPLSLAMQQSGADEVLTQLINTFFGQWGQWGIITGIYLLAMTLTLALHPAALVVILSPIVLQSAEMYDISPQSLMIMITIASASFISPISHPANLLMMAPAGYQFRDYLKLGLPLALFIMAIVFILLPIYWPL
jgi:di/tricarboxylate transporter